MRTRLAPSPTGALHLGNARTFLITWLLARQRGWKVLLRVEDLDGPRVKPGASQQAINDLTWLGIDWDEGPTYQSPRAAHYRGLVARLLATGNAYACTCSRREVDGAASAPHAEDGAAIYPGTCRGRFSSVDDAAETAGREPAVRFAVRAGAVEWTDGVRGKLSIDPQRELGDFVIQKNNGTAAYQLAVVADDAEAGVTHVVRGDDLTDSTPRQILLYRALGYAPTPEYFHLPLVIGPDGRRLAKRHGDTRVSHYRRIGVPAGRVVSLLARWCGMDVADDVRAGELLNTFDLSRVPKAATTFTTADDAWLRAGG